MDGPSEVLGLFDNGRSRLQMRFKAGSIPIENYALFSIFRQGGRVIQEGIAVDTLLVWCGRSATTLVAAGHISKQTLGQK